jgi:hypothetical protein
LEDRRISAKSIAEQLGISREWVGSTIHEDLDMRKVTKGVLFLNDNAPAHRALATQKKLDFQCVDHPPNSRIWPHPTTRLKKQLTGRYFSSGAEVIAAAETWLDGQPSAFCLSGL